LAGYVARPLEETLRLQQNQSTAKLQSRTAGIAQADELHASSQDRVVLQIRQSTLVPKDPDIKSF
jgi:hypothetical protein